MIFLLKPLPNFQLAVPAQTAQKVLGAHTLTAENLAAHDPNRRPTVGFSNPNGVPGANAVIGKREAT